MYTLFVVLTILASTLLVLVILAQNPKGGGLSSQFGGSGASNFIGVKKTSDLLEKLTWGFAFAIMALSMAVYISISSSSEQQTDQILERATEQQDLPDSGLDLNQLIPDQSDTTATP